MYYIYTLIVNTDKSTNITKETTTDKMRILEVTFCDQNQKQNGTVLVQVIVIHGHGWDWKCFSYWRDSTGLIK